MAKPEARKKCIRCGDELNADEVDTLICDECLDKMDQTYDAGPKRK